MSVSETGRRDGAALEALPPCLRHVALARHMHERRGEDTAAELGVTASRISQMHKRAIGRLREMLAKPLSQAARP